MFAEHRLSRVDDQRALPIGALTLLMVTLGIVLELCVLSFFIDPMHALLLACISAMVVLPWVGTILQRRAKPIEPIVLFSLLYGYMYVLQPASQLISGNSMFPDDDVETALFYAAAGALAFLVGYHLELSPRIARALPPLPRVDNPRRYVAATIGVATVGATALAYFTIQSGGVAAVLRGYHGSGFAWDQVSGYVYMSVDFLYVALLFFYLAWLRGWLGTLGKLAFIGFSIPALAVLVTQGERGETIYLVLGGVVIYTAFGRRRLTSKRLVALGFLLAVWVSALAELRYFFSLDRYDQITGESLVEGIERGFLRSGEAGRSKPTSDFDVYVLATRLYPNVLSYHYGAGYANVVARAIPRGLWDEKHEFLRRFAVRDDVTDSLGHRYSQGSTLTLLGFLHRDFGVVAILVGMFLSGVLWRIQWTYFLEHIDSSSNVLWYAVCFALLVRYVVFDPSTSIEKFSFWTAPVVVASLIARGKGKRRKDAA